MLRSSALRHSELRIRSHIVGASLFVPHENMVVDARTFYLRMFNRNQFAAIPGSDFVRHLDVTLMRPLGVAPPVTLTNMFTTASRDRHAKAMWVPHVAVNREHINQMCRSENKLLDFVATLSTSIRDRAGSELVMTNPDLTGGERLPFVLVYVDDAEPAFGRSNVSAPFPQQPKLEGVVNWTDLLVMNPSNQRRVAALLHRVFGWNMSKPLALGREPAAGEYITMLNDTGLAANRHKVLGMLPKAVLLPKLAAENDSKTNYIGSMSVPFLCCRNKEELMIRVGMAVSHGGEVLMQPIQADGDVTVIRDPFGGVVGLFNRTDKWDEVKPTTVVVRPRDMESCEAFALPQPAAAAAASE